MRILNCELMTDASQLAMMIPQPLDNGGRMVSRIQPVKGTMQRRRTMRLRR